MDKIVTLVVRRQQTPRGGPVVAIYTVSVYSSPSERDGAGYRCQGDLSLLRALEELLTSPQLRLETLERVRDRGEAVVRDVLVPGALIAKYGFGDREHREGGRADRSAGPVERLCAVCSLPTDRSDRLTMLSGEVVHYACRPGSRDATEVAARLLIESKGQAFCHSCLASLLHISFDETRKVVGILRARSGFSVGSGQCSVCERYRFTLGYGVTLESEAGP